MPADIAIIANTVVHPVPIPVGRIENQHRASKSTVPLYISGTMRLMPGQRIIIEAARINRQQLANLKALGCISLRITRSTLLDEPILRPAITLGGPGEFLLSPASGIGISSLIRIGTSGTYHLTSTTGYGTRSLFRTGSSGSFAQSLATGAGSFVYTRIGTSGTFQLASTTGIGTSSRFRVGTGSFQLGSTSGIGGIDLVVSSSAAIDNRSGEKAIFSTQNHTDAIY